VILLFGLVLFKVDTRKISFGCIENSRTVARKVELFYAIGDVLQSRAVKEHGLMAAVLDSPITLVVLKP